MVLEYGDIDLARLLQVGWDKVLVVGRVCVGWGGGENSEYVCV